MKLLKLTSGQAPIMDAEVQVAGGHTILRYLCDTRLPNNNPFYPRDDIKKRAIIDMMLDWHLTSLYYCSRYVEFKHIGEKAFMEKYKIFFHLPEQFPKEIHKNLKILNKEYLERGYWGNIDKPTLADIIFFHEILGLNLVGHDITKYPAILSFLHSFYTTQQTLRQSSAPLLAQVQSKSIQPYVQAQKL